MDNLEFHGTLTVKNRNLTEIDGIESVAAFDEGFVAINTSVGKITIEGDGMKIDDLSKEKGSIKIIGKINSISFDNVAHKRGVFGIFS